MILTKFLLVGAAGILAIVVTIFAVGWSLPVRHVARRSIEVQASINHVWNLLADFENGPVWRKDLRIVERLPEINHRPVWREIYRTGDVIDLEVTELQPEKRFIRRIANSLPFGGSWTVELDGLGATTRVTVTENGEVYNPIFRFVSRFILGHTATVDRYLGFVKTRFSTDS